MLSLDKIHVIYSSCSFPPAGSKFYGGWCPKGKGYAVVKDEVAPEKMTMYFDTTIGRQIGMKPAWMLKTDYEK